MAKKGITTGNLKLRSGPGMQYNPPLAYLKPDTTLEIIGEEEFWYHVRVGDKEGYVGKKYVKITEEGPALPQAQAPKASGLAPKATSKPDKDTPS